MRCKNRKDIIEQKRKDDKEGTTTFSGVVKKNITYAAVAQTNMPTPFNACGMPTTQMQLNQGPMRGKLM